MFIYKLSYFQVSMGAQLKPYKKKGRTKEGGEGSALEPLQEEGEETKKGSTETGFTWKVGNVVSALPRWSL